MGVIIKDNKVVIITESKAIHFDLPKDFIIKHNEFLVEHTIKNQILQLLTTYKHESNIHEYKRQ